MMNIKAPDIPREPASCKIDAGKRDTIPIMINIEIPLPIPLSVIFSPNHIHNIVPPIKIATPYKRKNQGSTMIASEGIVTCK